MSWFSRGRGHDDRARDAQASTARDAQASTARDAQASTAPDADLPPLSREDADLLRREAATAFARAGFVGAVAQPDHVRTPDGAQYGLANLARQVALVDRTQWPAVAAEHARMVRAAQTRPAQETLEDVLDLLVARVLLEQDLPEVDPAAGPSLGAGLCVRAAVDYPESVSTLFGSRFGGWAALGDAAMAGLRRLPAPDHELIEHGVHVLVSPDFFGASRVLLHDEVLDAVGATPRPFGTLVALPDRSALLVHVLRDETVVHALHLMARIALGRQETPGPLSPHVYYRSPAGELQQVTRYEDGGIQVHVDGPFADAMSAAGLTS